MVFSYGMVIYIKARNAGFTLVEMAIVLTIIGLLAAGILVGSNLISSAAVRGQIAQIEKYQSAVNAFDEKYGGLPGDLNSKLATQFGFSARGTGVGQGDGNGAIEGAYYCCNDPRHATYQGIGETTMFWIDLTSANGLNLNLIDGGFNTASETVWTAGGDLLPGTEMNLYFPNAKLGNGNYIMVYSAASINYFNIFVPILIGNSSGCVYNTNPGLTVRQAYDIDIKIDDGLPQSGTVTAMQVDNGWTWSNNLNWTAIPPLLGYTTATQGSSSTCFDNSTSANGQTASNGNAQHYSLEMNSGTGVNCSLSFMFANQNH